MTEENQLGSILCPNCRKLISASSEECFHCGMKRPNLWGFSGMLRKILGGQTSLIPIISIVCIVNYVLSVLIDPSAIMEPRGILGLLSPSGPALLKLGMTGSVAVARGQWWTLITAVYLHGSLLHIIFNVMWIRQLGPTVEDFYGISRSFLIFTIAGVFGFIFSSYSGHAFTLGASGSIFGLLGALVYYGRRRGGAFGTAIYRQTGQWAIVLFAMGFLLPNIDNFAHAGGFIGGYVSAMILGFTEIKPETRRQQLLAIGAIAVTILAFLLALLS